MEYEKCLVQVYEVLNYLDDEELIKIPESIIKNIENKKDNNYIWLYDEKKSLLEQDLDRKAIAILSYINIEYLLSEEEKDILKEMHELNEEKFSPKIKGVEFSIPGYENVEENNIETALTEVCDKSGIKKFLASLSVCLKVK